LAAHAALTKKMGKKRNNKKKGSGAASAPPPVPHDPSPPPVPRDPSPPPPPSPPHVEEESPAAPIRHGIESYVPGTRVRISGLAGAVALNGRRGLVVARSGDERVAVLVDDDRSNRDIIERPIASASSLDKAVGVRAANLEIVPWPSERIPMSAFHWPERRLSAEQLYSAARTLLKDYGAAAFFELQRRGLGPRKLLMACCNDQGSKRERNSQLQRLLSRPFSTRFG
jgi:hypothetical protein